MNVSSAHIDETFPGQLPPTHDEHGRGRVHHGREQAHAKRATHDSAFCSRMADSVHAGIAEDEHCRRRGFDSLWHVEGDWDANRVRYCGRQAALPATYGTDSDDAGPADCHADCLRQACSGGAVNPHDCYCACHSNCLQSSGLRNTGGYAI